MEFASDQQVLVELYLKDEAVYFVFQYMLDYKKTILLASRYARPRH